MMATAVIADLQFSDVKLAEAKPDDAIEEALELAMSDEQFDLTQELVEKIRNSPLFRKHAEAIQWIFEGGIDFDGKFLKEVQANRGPLDKEREEDWDAAERGVYFLGYIAEVFNAGLNCKRIENRFPNTPFEV